ncbi:MAG: hypothetical protein OXL41_02595 [Nitrospinae bacterium]|nr:hypothetical protein [Nitrospinota bacterium]
MEDIEAQRKNSRIMAERISSILAGEIEGVDADIRYSYQEKSFRLWWGDRGDPDTTALITFEQIATLNDEELRQIIRSSVIG